MKRLKEWLDWIIPLWRPLLGITLQDSNEKKITSSCTGFQPGTRTPINEKTIRG